MQPTPPAGWYADPNGSTSLRWWNGQAWTDDLSPVDTATATTTATAPPVASTFAPQTPTYPTPAYARQRSASTNANRFSLITIAVCAVYVVIAATAHVVFIGVFPALMAFRSFQAKEKLAPVAAIAAAVAIVVAVTALS